MRYNEFAEATWDSPESDITRQVATPTGNLRGAASLADIRRSERRAASGGAGGLNNVLTGLLGGGTTGAGTTGGTAGVGSAAPGTPGGGPTGVSGSGALFTLDGSESRMVRANAGDIMQRDTLPRFRRMQQAFGSTIRINDAIARQGTSRESQTQGSMHFHGRALDLSTAGMTNQQKLQLVRAAQQAGFTGFGFGSNILHVDTGPRRHWAYGNSTYGGVRVADLGAAVRSGRAVV